MTDKPCFQADAQNKASPSVWYIPKIYHPEAGVRAQGIVEISVFVFPFSLQYHC